MGAWDICARFRIIWVIAQCQRSAVRFGSPRFMIKDRCCYLDKGRPPHKARACRGLGRIGPHPADRLAPMNTRWPSIKPHMTSTGGRVATGTAKAVPHCPSHLSEIGRRLAQDLICLPKLTHVVFQFLYLFAFSAGRTIPCPADLFRQPNPDPSCLWDAASLWRNHRDSRRLRFARALMRQHHANGTPT